MLSLAITRLGSFGPDAKERFEYVRGERARSVNERVYDQRRRFTVNERLVGSAKRQWSRRATGVAAAVAAGRRDRFPGGGARGTMECRHGSRARGRFVDNTDQLIGRPTADRLAPRSGPGGRAAGRVRPAGTYDIIQHGTEHWRSHAHAVQTPRMPPKHELRVAAIITSSDDNASRARAFNTNAHTYALINRRIRLRVRNYNAVIRQVATRVVRQFEFISSNFSTRFTDKF